MTPLSGLIVTGAQMREAEDRAIAAGTTATALMERAGAAVAEAAWRFGGGRETLIACGPGNNGGDGYVAARLLAARGVTVRVAALRPPRTPAAIAAAALWTGPVESLTDAASAPVLIDALFGTGLRRPLDFDAANVLGRLNAAADFTLAVDLPSGVGTDDGRDMGAIAADYTLALGALKPAHVLQPAMRLCGRTDVADLGIALSSPVTVLDTPSLATPGPDSHKYRRGMVAVVAGAMPGAAMLAAKAAMRVSGYVVLCNGGEGGPDALVRRDWIDVASDSHVGALLIGPGLGLDADAQDALARALGSIHPLVLDADALRMLNADTLGQLYGRDMPSVLTPHAGEFAALFGQSSGSKIDRARDAAARTRTTIIFKGADTVIATPDGRVAVSSQAPGWLASAGTGDVLAGIVAGLLSGGMSPFDAAKAAVWLHSDAAKRAGPALIADDLPHHLPAAVAFCQ